MKTFWMFPAVAAAAAVADPANPNAPPHGVPSLSQDQMHKNVLNNHPAHWIVNSTHLEEYLLANRDANHTIYISDEKAFVSLATVEYDVERLATRDSGPCRIPSKYIKTYTKQTGQWPGAWTPASSCLFTGKSNLGGSEAISTSFALAIAENAGLSFTLIKDVLSATLGLTVTETYTTTRTWTCNVNANSVVQVWNQPYLAWGWFWSQSCDTNTICGGCGPEYVNGGATAPAMNPSSGQWLNYGCSTGQSNVRC
ncbi:hypothetical protein NQ176_g4157 [Zarea fungicola]|uniref:Uncharacterized protein n=1 Tax=Zarea fungicola TaxID=93591 RepID=A0ACC1NHJ6_9HYPO|nr:hypothetical protein NQ176_g4157 [Lecanicillium fungicola]